MSPTPRDAYLTPSGCMVVKAGDTKGLEAGQRRWSCRRLGGCCVAHYVGDCVVRWRLFALPHLISCDHHDERQGRNRPGGQFRVTAGREQLEAPALALSM